MKAKDYAKRFIANPVDKELGNIFKDFVGEIKTIALQRNVKTNAGLKSIIVELDKKWKAFANEVDKELYRLDGSSVNRCSINPNGFTDLIKLKFKDIYGQLMMEIINKED